MSKTPTPKQGVKNPNFSLLGMLHNLWEALFIFDLSRDKKDLLFPRNSPFNYEGDEDEDEDEDGESFCLDSACVAQSDEALHSDVAFGGLAVEKGIEFGRVPDLGPEMFVAG